MLVIAKKKLKMLGISNYLLIQADANKLPFYSGVFDFVLSTKFFHNVPAETHRIFFNEMSRVSRGLVLIEIMNKLMWFGLYHLISILGFGRKKYSRHYYPWECSRIIEDCEKLSCNGFGVGLPLSDKIFKIFPMLFKLVNNMMIYTPMKYFAPKLFLVIKTGQYS